MSEQKPVVNLDELEYREFGHGEGFQAKHASVASRIGATKLGYGVVSLEPGKKAWPYHAHFNNEEMFFVLEGEGTLRHGDQEFPIRAGDFIASPADPTLPHQIVNTSDGQLRYVCVSTQEQPEICLYPDSGKYGAYAGSFMDRDSPRSFFSMGRKENTLDYWDGEG